MWLSRHLILISVIQSYEFSIVSYDETLNQKPHLLLRKYAKTHLRQCKISKFSGRGPPDLLYKRKGGEGRV
jgi:hypothetical protein